MVAGTVSPVLDEGGGVKATTIGGGVESPVVIGGGVVFCELVDVFDVELEFDEFCEPVEAVTGSPDPEDDVDPVDCEFA